MHTKDGKPHALFTISYSFPLARVKHKLIRPDSHHVSVEGPVGIILHYLLCLLLVALTSIKFWELHAAVAILHYLLCMD